MGLLSKRRHQPIVVNDRPVIATALEGEAWLRHSQGWGGDLEDRVTAARRMLFVRALVDAGDITDDDRRGKP